MVDFLISHELIRYAILVAVFSGSIGLVYFFNGQLSNRRKIREALQSISRPGTGTRSSTQHLVERKENAWTTMLDAIEKAGLSLEDTRGDRLVAKLKAAGFTARAAPRVFTLAKLLLIIALPLAYILLVYLPGEPISDTRLYTYVLILALIGLYFPNIYLTARRNRRREQAVNEFPDCLDLLLICVEAGLGLEAAMDRVAREMVLSHPMVSKMISEVTLQTRAGAERELALRRMGDDSGVEEIRSFSTLLIQSDKLGASIASTLRVYASEMRERRKLRAEERANRLPVLMSLPLVVCMLPTVVSVLMLPGIIRAVRVLLPALNGG